MEIRLIAMDLDGTALQKDRCSFSPKLLDALSQAHRRGIMIVPVTGRQFGLLPPVLQQRHEWMNYAILCNGGQIRKFTGELLYGLHLDSRALGQLLDVAAELDLPIEFSVDSRLYLTRDSYDKQLSRPELTQGDRYEVFTGGELSGEESGGLYSKITGYSGEGTMTIKQVYTRFYEVLEQARRGIDKRCTITTALKDPDSMNGEEERYSVDNVALDSLPLVNYAAGKVNEQTIPFRFLPGDLKQLSAIKVTEVV